MRAGFWLRELVAQFAEDPVLAKSAVPQELHDGREIWRRKVFCILSSQTRTEVAERATRHLFEADLFFDPDASFENVQQLAFEVLRSERIGYRFPKVRAAQIAMSWFAFCQIRDDYPDYIRSIGDDYQKRDAIVKVFSGLGLKQASMFLRDIGASTDLAIVDTHIIWYLWKVHNIEVEAITPRRYLALENILRSDAASFGIAVGVLDSIIWSVVRAMKRLPQYV